MYSPLNSAIFTQNQPQMGALFFDSWLSERHQSDCLITMQPIEAGANITDNAVVQPVVVDIDIIVGSIVAGFPLASIFLGTNRPQDALQHLYQLQANKTPLQLICLLASYDNMLIKSIRAKRDTETATSLLATVTLQQIIITDSQANNTTNNPADPQYSKPVKGGVKQTQPVPT